MNFTSILLMILITLILALIIILQVLLKIVNLNKELKNEINKRNRIEIKKESIDTGNNFDDFNSTIELLREYSKKRN